MSSRAANLGCWDPGAVFLEQPCLCDRTPSRRVQGAHRGSGRGRPLARPFGAAGHRRSSGNRFRHRAPVRTACGCLARQRRPGAGELAEIVDVEAIEATWPTEFAKALLRDRKVGLHVIEQGIDTSTMVGRAVFGMLSALGVVKRCLRRMF
jgi:hypothetical protein